LGSLEVRNVSSEEIVDVLDKSGQTWTMQKRIKTSVSKLLDHAIGRQLVRVNPVAGIKLTALIGPRPPVRKLVMLSKDELRNLLTRIEDISTETQCPSGYCWLHACVP
jgi:hypothetical protein